MKSVNHPDGMGQDSGDAVGRLVSEIVSWFFIILAIGAVAVYFTQRKKPRRVRGF